MCPKPPEVDTMVLENYQEIDNSGSINGGESVFYKCKEANNLLNDNSGLAVFEAHCNISDPDNPTLPDTASWPICEYQPLCTVIPEPDSLSKASGLELDSSEADPALQLTALMSGEFVVYNCTNEYQPVTETGSFFSLECINGEFHAPPDEKWPICRELAAYVYTANKICMLDKFF